MNITRFVGAAALAAVCGMPVIAGAALADAVADPASDAPQERVVSARPLRQASSYPQALATWRHADDINAWIGAAFEYDRPRALLLSETQRNSGSRLAIHRPESFFAAPLGVCVDLARFAVETLRAVDPKSNPKYLMIEFDPVSIEGQTLRRHWVVSFERDGALYVFADSKRPGHVAGPYATTAEFIADYARYRRRAVVSFRQLDSYERQVRAAAGRQHREDATR